MEELSNTTNNSDECQELKNIKYKTMLLNGAPLKETKSSSNLENLEKFLENEKNTNINEPWCKLNKTLKNKKLQEYVETYAASNKLSDDESVTLIDFLKDCIDRKKLQRVKDVIYDKTTGLIKDIPALCYIKQTKRFTLKNMDNKRVSTLKSLAPKKSSHITARHNVSVDDNDSEEEN